MHLRAGFFFENLIRFAAPEIARQNAIDLPFGDGMAKLAWVGGVDVARVAAAILASPAAHLQKTYEITGAQTLSIAEIAGVMSKVLGRSVVYSGLDLADWLTRRRPVLGTNQQLRRHLTVLSNAFGSGQVIGRSTTTVQDVAGCRPQECAEFVAEHACSFQRRDGVSR